MSGTVKPNYLPAGQAEQSGDEVTVYVGIGNSDDKLSQREWSDFCADLRDIADAYAVQFLGEWYSLPNRRWQNAEVAWTMRTADLDGLRQVLTALRRKYQQDSIALAIVQRTEFV